MAFVHSPRMNRPNAYVTEASPNCTPCFLAAIVAVKKFSLFSRFCEQLNYDGQIYKPKSTKYNASHK